MKYKSTGIVRKTHEQIDVKERGLIVGSADRGPGAASSCLSRPDGEQTSVNQKAHMFLKARDNMNNMNTMCLTESAKRSFLCRTDKDFVDR